METHSGNHRIRGIDVYYYRTGEKKKLKCRLCGVQCKVERNVYMSVGYAAAVGGIKHHYDIFTCPNAGTRLHHLASNLRARLNSNELGPRETEIVEADYRQVLKLLRPATHEEA